MINSYMKKLYTFKWESGKTERPLQAKNVNHALMTLAGRLQQNAGSNDFEAFRKMVFIAFHDERLTYKLDDPYQHIRQPNPPPTEPPKKKSKDKPKDKFQDLSFKGYVDNNREEIQRIYGPI